MQEVFEPRHLALGVLAIALATLLLWWLLQRAAGKARHHFDDLLELAQNSLEAQSDVALARRRLTALRLVVNAAKYALTLSALLMALRWLGVPLDSLLLPAGFLGAALGLGAQNMVRDIVAGLFIVFEGQFAVGDVVSINGTVGTVDEIGLRVTRLRAESGHLHYFPNGAITAVEKYPRGHVPLRLCVPLSSTAPQRDAHASVTTATAPNTSASDAAPLRVASVSGVPASDDAASDDAANDDAANVGAEAAAAIVLNAIRRFAADYHALDDATSIVCEKEAGEDSEEKSSVTQSANGTAKTLCFRLPVRPLRAAVTREKLPPRVAAALEAAGAKLLTGAEITISSAPEDQS